LSNGIYPSHLAALAAFALDPQPVDLGVCVRRAIGFGTPEQEVMDAAQVDVQHMELLDVPGEPSAVAAAGRGSTRNGWFCDARTVKSFISVGVRPSPRQLPPNRTLVMVTTA
jgi:hypothetical protein